MAKKILFVDDEPDVLKVVTFRLKKAGYDVANAIDGQEALNLIKAEKFDLIFLDLRLPNMNGMQICEIIRSEESLKDIPVILFTASLDSLQKRVEECKANDYLVKPFEPELLLDKVKKIIG